MEKALILVLSFTNAKEISIRIEPKDREDIEKQLFSSLNDAKFMQIANVIFQCKEISFAALVEKEMEEPVEKAE